MATFDSVMVLLKHAVEAAIAPLQSTPPAPKNHKVYRGWPIPETLNNDLRSRIVHVSVASGDGGGQGMDDYLGGMSQITDPVVQLTATVSGTQLNAPSANAPAVGTITLAGTVVEGTHTMVHVGSAYVPYTPSPGDTSDQVAAAITAAVNADSVASTIVTANVVGSTITLTTLANAVNGQRVVLEFHIGGTAQFAAETGRERAEFQVNIWGYDDDSRALYSNTIETALNSLGFLVPDSDVPAKIDYVRKRQVDRELSHVVYRRTLVYSVQYTQTALTTGYQVLAGLVEVQRGGS